MARRAAGLLLVLWLGVLTGCVNSDAETGGVAQSDRTLSALEVLEGKSPRWVRRSLPFLATEGAELVFLDDGPLVLVVGDGAAISTDLGRTWQVLEQQSSSTRYSNDGGRVYVDLETTRTPWYVNGAYDTRFSSAQTCIAGGRLYVFGVGSDSNRLTSIGLLGGATYHRVFWYHGPKSGCLGAAGDRVFAGGDVRDQPVLYSTTDDGASWVPVWWGREGDPSPQALAFLDSSRGYMLLTDGTVVRTSDAAETWQTAGALPLDRGGAVRSMTFTDDSVGYVVGEDGLALATHDGARTWVVLHPPTIQHLNRVVARGERLWVVGDSGTILSSADGGRTWTIVDLGIGENLRSLKIHLSATWVVGDGCLYILPPEDGSPLVAEPARLSEPAHPFAARSMAPDAPGEPSADRDPFADDPVAGKGDSQ
ncbi:MAG: hypothetical protein IT175_11945 [Acidobacteria bacterium]|nr:hypothetical protein [Acidobacteriota bacterium]